MRYVIKMVKENVYIAGITKEYGIATVNSPKDSMARRFPSKEAALSYVNIRTTFAVLPHWECERIS